MRLIDADALEDVAAEYQERHADDLPLTVSEYKLIDNFLFEYPTVDAVPVVRCKDCKWFRDSNGIDGFCYCDRIYRHCGTHWFCADGERKEDE